MLAHCFRFLGRHSSQVALPVPARWVAARWVVARKSLTREIVHVLPSFASRTFLAFRFLDSFWIRRGTRKSFVLWIWLCCLRFQRAVLRSLARVLRSLAFHLLSESCFPESVPHWKTRRKRNPFPASLKPEISTSSQELVLDGQSRLQLFSLNIASGFSAIASEVNAKLVPHTHRCLSEKLYS